MNPPPEIKVPTNCDFHRWMTAHFFVMDHPFFAVTDARGQFKIPDLPPGKYTLEAWHEVFGKQRQQVTVSKDGSVSNFQFRAQQ